MITVCDHIQGAQAGEAIREYGLTPDGVHDSFNMWMHTCGGENLRFLRNIGPQGDYVDLLICLR